METNSDIELDDTDFEGYSSGNSGQDVWDFISEEDDEDDYSSDMVDGDAAGSSSGYDAAWLSDKCASIAFKTGMSPDVFEAQVSSSLTSGRPDEELQMELTDLVGFDDLDFIIELLANKDQVVASIAAQSQPAQASGRKLLSKAQRDEQLRRQDYEHKNAALAPSFAREVQYPHVYKTHSAGNTLSYAGKKYGLPAGSERLQFDKYEEYFIPAGQKGKLLPGQQLVKIADLDGLCRNTFKGYKSLNRMQSLVYPVGYKTSENMLICAPTGAGKTDAAMLTILHTIGQHVLPNPMEDHEATEFAVNADDFKIVYVAPMKALAAEITEKLGKRLAWLGIKCRERSEEHTSELQSHS